jgi:hypothetical protein
MKTMVIYVLLISLCFAGVAEGSSASADTLPVDSMELYGGKYFRYRLMDGSALVSLLRLGVLSDLTKEWRLKSLGYDRRVENLRSQMAIDSMVIIQKDELLYEYSLSLGMCRESGVELRNRIGSEVDAIEKRMVMERKAVRRRIFSGVAWGLIGGFLAGFIVGIWVL